MWAGTMRRPTRPAAMLTAAAIAAVIAGCAAHRAPRKVCTGVIGRCVDRAAKIGMGQPNSEKGCLSACIRYGLLSAERAIQNRFLSKGKSKKAE